MKLSNAAIIFICVLGALSTIATCAAIYKLYKGPKEPAWNPNERNPEQQARLNEVRDINNRQAWTRAVIVREELGLPVPA